MTGTVRLMLRTIACVLVLGGAEATAAPVISGVQTTDVTPFGFSVVWGTSEPAAPGIVIFADAAGTQDITNDFAVTAYPLRAGDPQAADEQAAEAAAAALRAASRSRGLARISVTGGAPGTTYYYRVRSTAGGETAQEPSGAPIAVTTPIANSFLTRSQQLLLRMGSPASEGWIVTATSPQASTAVSAIVGDGAEPDQAFLNLAQMFEGPALNFEPVGLGAIEITVRTGGGTPLTRSFDLPFIGGFSVAQIYRLDFATTPGDSDLDGLSDEEEASLGTDPNDPDSDDDGLADGQETSAGTNPLLADSDSDGLSDGAEVGTHGTNPLAADTDGDGYTDGAEVLAGTDPRSAGSTPCGDGEIGGPEACDDANHLAGDGCSAACTLEAGYVCSGSPSVCLPGCGDGLVVGTEGCDDGGLDPGDGCAAICQVEIGWTCAGAPSSCTTICGDGSIFGSEECDDSNTGGGDGCTATCTVEGGWNCNGQPSSCMLVGVCGDGTVEGFELCDDGGVEIGDGCSPFCVVERGWMCMGSPSICGPLCGDGRIVAPETCDDGNALAGDGCSDGCVVEAGSVCANAPSVCAEIGTTACSNEIDDDDDGAVDLLDSGCRTLVDSSEQTDCGDGVDNDGDGWADFGADDGCVNVEARSEIRVDLDFDGIVGEGDRAAIESALGRGEGDPGYLPEADFNGNRQITIVDFQMWRAAYEEYLAAHRPPRSCGLVGLELLSLVAALRLIRRRGR